MGGCYRTIVELKEQNLVKVKEIVQKYDDGQQVKKCKAVMELQENKNRSRKKNSN